MNSKVDFSFRLMLSSYKAFVGPNPEVEASPAHLALDSIMYFEYIMGSIRFSDSSDPPMTEFEEV